MNADAILQEIRGIEFCLTQIEKDATELLGKGDFWQARHALTMTASARESLARIVTRCEMALAEVGQ